jgi:hypothetical protein
MQPARRCKAHLTPDPANPMGDSQTATENRVATLGFLTVVENEQFGMVGGYLLLNRNGRPLEFHCTAPVRPSRAQRILFGPTLAPYLYGEQIAQALINKASAQPVAAWTDRAAVLAVQEFVDLPVAAIAVGNQSLEQLGSAGLNLQEFAVGRVRAVCARSMAANDLTARMEEFAGFDLNEPFERIREAIDEAHRNLSARQAA